MNLAVRVAGIAHTAELHGIIEGNNVTWDMFITREGEYTDFNWFSGVSTLTRTEGSWTLNKDPENPVPFIDIEWHADEEAGTGDITYTNVEPQAAANGSYIAYALSTDEPYQASYAIFNAETDNLTEIHWSPATQAGRVRDPAHFADTDWHCWDQDHQNIACPEGE